MSSSSRVLQGGNHRLENVQLMMHEVKIRTEGKECRQRGHHRERNSEELDDIGQEELAGIYERPVFVPLRSLQNETH
jgi:hypothetical protein